MKKITIIPAIDIIEGRCVRLTRGDYSTQKVYSEDPVEIARWFEQQGFKRLHLVDLDGARRRKVVNLPVLQRVREKTQMIIDFGGGVQSTEDLSAVFQAGAHMVTSGSIAIKRPETVIDWLEQFGADKIILGADVKNEKIAIHGWQEGTDFTIYSLIEKYLKQGIKKVICTDISRDGLLQGPNFELYRKLRLQFPDLEIIASGGVHSRQDIARLQNEGIDGVIVGKAFYEGTIKPWELEEFLC